MMPVPMRGFSLIEMAVVLLVVTLLLGGLLVPFATQVEQRRIAETQKALEEIKEALIGFAIRNGRLPCPASAASNGVEVGPLCTESSLLPWATLGLPRADAWGRLYRYRVSSAFANAPFNLTSASSLTVQTRSPAGGLVNLTVANGAVAVVFSHGPNGYGGTTEHGSAMAAVPIANTDERTNHIAGFTFVARAPTRAANPCGGAGQPLCEFDDLVVWLSPNVLFNRMVAAGRLP